jgi:hypothetical protein
MYFRPRESSHARTSNVDGIEPLLPSSPVPVAVSAQTRHIHTNATICPCVHPGCITKAQTRGLCVKHGAKDMCVHRGCTTKAQTRGLCVKHGANDMCVHRGCTTKAHRRGLCVSHGLYTAQSMAKIKICQEPDCTSKVIVRGRCRKHNKALNPT